MKWAHLSDPFAAVDTSNIEPYPHQIEAVYDKLLPKQPLRYLLADDPGAGKTIMSGLLIRELILRGDVARCLIVAPGSLVESVSLTAGNVLSLNTVSVRAQSVSLEARTVALKNVNFRAGSAVTLRSETGLLAAKPNTNRPVELGKVNFIRNVNYGGLPAQRAVRTGDIVIGK